jgi:hypothetical protein
MRGIIACTRSRASQQSSVFPEILDNDIFRHVMGTQPPAVHDP